MIAIEFIDQLFSRPRFGGDLAGESRRLTRPQFDLLLTLIGENEQAGAVHPGLGRSCVWAPTGRYKYVITEDAGRDRHTIIRLSNFSAASSGMLF